MSVRILPDKPSAVYTSLDNITGRVQLNLLTEEHITSITVKLEGVARSRLPIPYIQGQREGLVKAEVEYHKLVHVTETVFPPAQLRKTSTGSSGFTLKPGKYEYPFSIRIPINNKCVPPGLLQKFAINMEKGGIDIAKEAQHVTTTLPPSLSGIPGEEAWIRYFVKATVNNPVFFKQNARAVEFFVFLPIEPPRPSPTKSEAFARRQYLFAPELAAPVKKPKRSLFQFKSKSPLPPTDPGPPPRFSIETRLPSPPILVPNDPLPLRIIMVKLEPFTAMLFVRSLQINLRTYTTIRAHGLIKTARDVIPVYTNMKLTTPVGDSSTPEGSEMEVDNRGWMAASLPETVAPSFQTCNISRFYEMEITIGVSNGLNGGINTIPLIMPVEVYSGIAPPPDLVRYASVRSTRSSFPPSLPPRTNTVANGFKYSASAANSPVSPSAPTPQRAQSHAGSAMDAPPPTYEEALAADIGPVDIPRQRNYPQDQNYFVDRVEETEPGGQPHRY